MNDGRWISLKDCFLREKEEQEENAIYSRGGLREESAFDYDVRFLTKKIL